MSERKTPVLLRRGGFSGGIFAITRYTATKDRPDLITAHVKHDVTQDFYRCAAEEWPHLVTEGYLTPRTPSATQETP